MELRDSSKTAVKRESTSTSGGGSKRKREGSSNSQILATTAGNNQVAGLVREVIESHTCPITHNLMCQPCVAEDGHMYVSSILKEINLCAGTNE